MESGDDVLEFIKPWRCEGPCKELMYNKDGNGYPAPGAPIGFTVHLDIGVSKRVCCTCAEMYLVVRESSYMHRQHTEWMQESQQRKEKLGSSGKYLD